MEKTKRPFVIDCDTGTDDAIAIMTALYSPEVEVKAITSVNGNVPLEWTTKNNLNMIEYLGFDIPVARGADSPFVPLHHYYSDTHGNTGMGTVVLPDAAHSACVTTDAATLIHDIAVEAEGTLELLVIGPMTNIGIALMNYPNLKRLIKHIWFMGGAATGGNVSPTAEFNIWVDPLAAHMVCESGIPLTMVGLDVTEKAVLNKEDTDEIRRIGTRAAELTADILDYMLLRCKGGGEDAVMHDALAFCAAVAPECLELTPCFVDIECRGQYTLGHTMVDIKGRLKQKPNVDVALDLHLPEFKKWMKACIRNSAE